MKDFALLCVLLLGMLAAVTMIMAGAYGRGTRAGWALGVQETYNRWPHADHVQAWSDSAYAARFGGFWNMAVGRPKAAGGGQK